MKGLTIVASLVLGLAVSAAEAHPRLFPHSHNRAVVVKKEVVVKPAPVRNAVAYTLGAAFDTIPGNHVSDGGAETAAPQHRDFYIVIRHGVPPHH